MSYENMHDHWKMCVHESAHAVLHSHYGGSGALISEDFVQFVGSVWCNDRDAARIRITMAGYAAEAIVDPDGDAVETLIFKLENEFEQALLWGREEGIETDSQFVFRMIQGIRKTGRAQTRLLYKLAEETLALVHNRWTEIESLATEVRTALLDESGEGAHYYPGLPEALP